MVMARQRDRVDVNRAVGEHIGIGSNWKVCYRFGAGQNTRMRIGDGGGVSGGGTYRESRNRVVCPRGRLVRWLRPRGGALSVRCRARRRRSRSVAEPCRRFWQTRSDRAPYGHWLSKPFCTIIIPVQVVAIERKKICKDE